MKIKFYYLILGLFCSSVFADKHTNQPAFLTQLKQQKNNDPEQSIQSAITTYQSQKLNSEHTLALLRFIIEGLQNNGDYKQAKTYNESLKLLSLQTKNNFYLALYWLYNSEFKNVHDKELGKLKDIKLAEKLIINNDIMPLKSKLYFYLGSHYRQQDQLQRALYFYQLAVKQALTDSDKAQGLNQLGSIHKKLYDLPEAIKLLEQALEIETKLNNESGIANVLYNLAGINMTLGHFELAIEQYQNSAAIDLKTGAKNNYAYSLTKLCYAFIAVEKFEFALESCFKSKEIFTGFNASTGLSWVNSVIGNIYLKQQKYPDAENMLTKNLIQYQEKISPWVRLDNYYFLAQTYLAQGKLHKAEQIALQAEAYEKEKKQGAQRLRFLELLATIYSELEQHIKANHYLVRYIALYKNDIIEKETHRINKLKDNIAFLTKENEIMSLTQQQKIAESQLSAKQAQFNFWLLLITSLLLLILGLSLFLFQKKKNAQRERNLFEQYLSNKNKLLADVSHELRTPLTGLKLQVESLRLNIEDDIELSYDTLDKRLDDISELINDIHILAQSDTGTLTLNIETTYVNELLSHWSKEFQLFVEKQGLNWQFINKTIPSNQLDIDQMKVKQVLLNLLNNSVLYTDKPGMIKLVAYIKEDTLLIELEDSSPTVPADKLSMIFERLYRLDSSRSRATGGSGLGLAICQSLVTAQNGEISAQQSELKGVKITIQFPLKC